MGIKGEGEEEEMIKYKKKERGEGERKGERGEGERKRQISCQGNLKHK